ncbi:hypothetical protein [Asaia krungthepensis]|uniref:Outer membrane autotransporter n=1 Tax=Asaia krungthepensis NRIC 0535 TaxID=1307925 RepID=A0ABQ0Q3Q1_9PROT|nr:hypothetical protein [Asaia krungthepensis]GBQ89915.1 hypothetical protein AA0535_1919 [Asaia krungthepensis NRIC 0535]
MVTSTVRPNQTASNVTLNSGDYLFVSSGATVINGSIAAGASVYVNAAAVLSGSIRNGGRISGGTLQGPDTTLTNSAGGYLEAAAIGSGAVVTNSGYMTSVVVASGGIVNTYDGPVTSTIVQGGTLNCYSRDIISGITFAGQGGTVNLMSGVVQTAPFVFSGNGTVYVQSGAVMGKASIGPGATMEVLGGGGDQLHNHGVFRRHTHLQ